MTMQMSSVVTNQSVDFSGPGCLYLFISTINLGLLVDEIIQSIQIIGFQTYLAGDEANFEYEEFDDQAQAPFEHVKVDRASK